MLRPITSHGSRPWRIFASITSTPSRSFKSSCSCLVNAQTVSEESQNEWLSLSSAGKQGAAEDVRFQDSVKQLKRKWESPHKGFEGIKRPYSAESVVAKRGTLDMAFPSSEMAKKLAFLLHNKAVKGEPVHTSKHEGGLKATAVSSPLINGSGSH